MFGVIGNTAGTPELRRLEELLQPLEVTAELGFCGLGDARAREAQHPAWFPLTGDLEESAAAGRFEGMADAERDRALHRLDVEPVWRVVDRHLVHNAELAAHEAARLPDASALAERALRRGADRARLPLREAVDVRQRREDVLGRTVDLDLHLEA